MALQLPALIASHGLANSQLYRIDPFELVGVHETGGLAEITTCKCNSSGIDWLCILSLVSLRYAA